MNLTWIDHMPPLFLRWIDDPENEFRVIGLTLYARAIFDQRGFWP